MYGEKVRIMRNLDKPSFEPVMSLLVGLMIVATMVLVWLI